ERLNQSAVVTRRHFLPGFDGGDHFGNAVDDPEHRAHQMAVGNAAAGANVGECILGGMAERLKPREFEEAAIALHRVDEAENRIEPRAVVGLRFPGDDFPAQGFEHFAAFGYEIGNQVIHWLVRPPALVREALCRGGVNAALSVNGFQARGMTAPIISTGLDASDSLIVPPASAARLWAS